MSPTPAARSLNARGRRPRTAVLATATLLTLLLAACGSGAKEIPEDTRAAGLGREDVVSSVREDTAVSSELPAKLRRSGVLRIGSGIGVPPIAFSPEDGGEPRGVDIDVSEAVARVLGLKTQRKHVSGASLITGLNAGRYDLGTANLAVTEEREQVLDFVLYLTDGTGFAVRDDSGLKKVDDLGRLCGLRAGTGTGTTFEADLRAASEKCAAGGGKPITISTYPDAASHFLALRQGRVDILMTSSSVLRYAATQQPGLRFLGETGRKNVGLAVKKGSPLAGPVRDAVNRLIEDGTYAKILKKWRLEPAGIGKSVVNPPETP